LVGIGRLDDENYPAFSVGQAAELLGVQQAFLRRLDSAGVVRSERSGGGHRRYSRRQLARAARVRELFDEGHDLAAAAQILALEDERDQIVGERDQARDELNLARQQRDEAREQRDEAREQRDQAREQRDEAYRLLSQLQDGGIASLEPGGDRIRRRLSPAEPAGLGEADDAPPQ